jgi:hypothetical protein
VSTDGEIADYLDVALILFIVFAAITLLVLLETRSGAAGADHKLAANMFPRPI